MSLNSKEIEQIAHLARLGVEPQEIEGLGKDLSNILDLVAQMDAVDTSGVEPMSHPLEMVQRLRADEVTEENHREDYQSIAPETESGLYLVPQVIE